MPTKLNTKQFVEKSKLIHGNKYKYDFVSYIKSNTKVTITCRIHGNFEQRPNDHLSEKGCKKCADTQRGIAQSSTTNDFVMKSKKVHKNKYDYSDVVYINNYTKVKIMCEDHGLFYQIPNDHLSGKGCMICGGTFQKTITGFVEEARLVHGDLYDYSESVYKSALSYVNIMCKKHGNFEQTPNAHIQGQGCPRCRNSKGELLIDSILTNLGIKFKPQYKIKECRNKRPLPFDFGILNEDSSLKGLIEFHGRQHKEIVEVFGGIKGFKETQKRDKIKSDYCETNNIPLLVIWYDQIDKVESLIRVHLNRIL